MKIIIAVLAISAVFFSSCVFSADYPPPDDDDNFTDVVYSSDGKSITIYLEGGVPVTSQSRALNTNLARMGHDFFEAVFFGGDGQPTARASWEIGQSARISGVPSVNYGTAIDSDPTKPAAIIFVGRSSCRTLLAVGTISSTNGTGSDGDLTDNTITSVTFAVSALDAGTGGAGFPRTTSSYTALNSSSLTYAALTVNLSAAASPPVKMLPLHVISEDDETQMRFTVGGINDYLAGVRIAGNGSVEQRTPPRFIAQNNRIALDVTPLATAVSASMPALTAESAFTGYFDIDITPEASNPNRSGFFSLTFQVPVYAVNQQSSSSGNPAVNWFIRPCFGQYRYDLDDGTNGLGGSVLLYAGAAPPSEIVIYVP